MQENPAINPDIRFFSFYCPDKKLHKAHELLDSIQGVSVLPLIDLEDGKQVTSLGIELIGLTTIGIFGQVVNALAAYKLADYSSATTVYLNDTLVEAPLKEQKQEAPYVPAVRFKGQSLSITFDPYFKETPIKPKDDSGSFMTLEIIYGQIPYAQLKKLPRHVVSRVVASLKIYVEDQCLTQKQIAMINLAIYRIEKILSREN